MSEGATRTRFTVLGAEWDLQTALATDGSSELWLATAVGVGMLCVAVLLWGYVRRNCVPRGEVKRRRRRLTKKKHREQV